MYIPSGLSSLYVMGRFGVVILAVGLVFAMGGGSAESPDAMITFAFYEGDISVIENVYPILNLHDYKGDVYIATDMIGDTGKLTEEDLISLFEAGWGIGSHGLTYQDLTNLNEEDILYQLTESKNILTEIVPEVNSFYIPYDSFNNNTLDLISQKYSAAISSYGNSANDLPLREGDQYRINALNFNDLDLDEAKLIIDNLENDQWLIIALEGIGNNHNWSENEFTELVNYINNNGFSGLNNSRIERTARL